jgi:hypothetical protein
MLRAHERDHLVDAVLEPDLRLEASITARAGSAKQCRMSPARKRSVISGAISSRSLRKRLRTRIVVSRPVQTLHAPTASRRSVQVSAHDIETCTKSATAGRPR